MVEEHKEKVYRNNLLKYLPKLEKKYNVKLYLTGSLATSKKGNDVDLIMSSKGLSFDEATNKAFDIADGLSEELDSKVDCFIPFLKEWLKKKNFATLKSDYGVEWDTTNFDIPKKRADEIMREKYSFMIEDVIERRDGSYYTKWSNNMKEKKKELRELQNKYTIKELEEKGYGGTEVVTTHPNFTGKAPDYLPENLPKVHPINKLKPPEYLIATVYPTEPPSLVEGCWYKKQNKVDWRKKK